MGALREVGTLAEVDLDTQNRPPISHRFGHADATQGEVSHELSLNVHISTELCKMKYDLT